MIPILYGPNERDFTSNGLARLTDCIEFTVSEERNGRYEAQFKYPVTGVHFDDIQEGNIVSCTHDEQGDRQPFIIYQHTVPDLNGVVTFLAHHISYRLSNVILRPFTATSAAEALSKFSENAMTEDPFSYWTDKASGGSFEVKVPSAAKAMLGGVKGSILDVFGGGEYEWDGYLVKLYQNRGTDSGVTIRYGKNLTALKQTYDTLDLYNAVIPYWADNEGNVVYGGVVTGSGGIGRNEYWTEENGVRMTDENAHAFTFDFAISQTTTMDLSNEFDETPTADQLEARALEIMNSNEPWAPKENLKIDFVALWQTEEYANIAPLERVRLCDTVTVYYPELNINAKTKVISTEYDALSDRYSSIELGAAKSSFAQVLTAETEEKLDDLPSKSMMQEAIDHATSLITGGLGGHVVFRYDANGRPTEILIMDTEDENTAVHVLRINVNGIGFSNTGPSGIFNTAWTLDGSFVADFITAGTLSANRIKGGTLTLGGADNGNGVIAVNNADGDEIGRWDKNGMKISSAFTFQNERQEFFIDKVPTIYGYYNPESGNSGIGTRTIPGTNIYMKDTEGTTVGAESWCDFDGELGSHASVTKRNVYTRSVVTNASSVPPIIRPGSQVDTYYYCTEAFFKAVYYRKAFNTISSDTRAHTFYQSGTTLNVTSSLSASLHTRISSGYRLDLDDDGMTICGGVSRIRVKSDSINIYANDNETSHTKPFISVDEDGVYIGSGWLGSYLYLRISSTIQQINGKTIQFTGSSSKRYKHDIADLTAAELDAHRLYRLNAKQFVFNDGHPLQYADMEGQTLPGFVAEDVAEIYPAAVIHDHEGRVENWDERRIIPGMLKLIQEQHAEIEELKARLEKLEQVVHALTNDMR